MTIKAITFDFWATLYRNWGSGEERLRVLHEFLRTDGHPTLAWEATAAAARETWQRWDHVWRTEQRTIGALEWLQGFSQRLPLDLSDDQLQHLAHRMEEMLLDHRPEPVAEAPAVLADLAQRYALGIISDTGVTPGRTLRKILDQDGLSQYFRHFTFSDELGRSKPHPSAYLTTLAGLQATPTEAVHVGDLPHTDILGAQRVGMRSVRYRGVKDTPHPSIEADAVIDDHGKLPSILKRWETANGES